MKTLKLLAALLIGFAAHAQSDSYSITSYAEEGFLATRTTSQCLKIQTDIYTRIGTRRQSKSYTKSAARPVISG